MQDKIVNYFRATESPGFNYERALTAMFFLAISREFSRCCATFNGVQRESGENQQRA